MVLLHFARVALTTQVEVVQVQEVILVAVHSLVALLASLLPVEDLVVPYPVVALVAYLVAYLVASVPSVLVAQQVQIEEEVLMT